MWSKVKYYGSKVGTWGQKLSTEVLIDIAEGQIAKTPMEKKTSEEKKEKKERKKKKAKLG